MLFHFLPAPRETRVGPPTFPLDDLVTVIVNKAKIQDHVMDFFGYAWRSFKIKLKITPIRDRDFEDDFDKGFFMLVSHEPELPLGIAAEFSSLLGTCSGEGYVLRVDERRMLMVSRTLRGFFNGVLTIQQLGVACTVSHDATSNRVSVLFPSCEIVDHPVLDIRAIHLDLKFQLHSLEYLKDHIRMLARYKINAVVWEWEDKFPYKRRPDLKHPLAFNKEEASSLMELCNMYGIESIPLVQTFGHLEFVLKHPEHAHLKETRELERDPNDTLDICPLQDGTMPLIEDMIADVVSFHPKSRYFHIGGDEVYTIGTCERCKAYIAEHGGGDAAKGKGKLYVMHVNRVSEIVKGFGKRPMIWHDYLLKYPGHLDELDKDVVIVYWMYGRDEPAGKFEEEIRFFTSRGFKVMVANSVRSDFQYAIPNYSTRFQNVHELHLASQVDPENVIGTLATSWACCHAPMETTVPGLLFFAHDSWAVERVPHSTDLLRAVTRSILSLYFNVPVESIPASENILVMLERSTFPPVQASNLEVLGGEIDACIAAWEVLATVARAGKETIANVLHGLKLQRLKVDVLALVDSTIQSFEQDALPSHATIDGIVREALLLRGKIDRARDATRSLYEAVMYDDEVRIQLSLRFDLPLSMLDAIADALEPVVKAGPEGTVPAQQQARVEDALFGLSVKRLQGGRALRF